MKRGMNELQVLEGAIEVEVLLAVKRVRGAETSVDERRPTWKAS